MKQDVYIYDIPILPKNKYFYVLGKCRFKCSVQLKTISVHIVYPSKN